MPNIITSKLKNFILHTHSYSPAIGRVDLLVHITRKKHIRDLKIRGGTKGEVGGGQRRGCIGGEGGCI